MKVLFYSTYGLWTPHMETELELADRHLADGDDVHWITCDGVLGACDANPMHRRQLCRTCQLRVAGGHELLRGRVHTRDLSDFVDEALLARLDAIPADFASKADLEDFRVEGFDAGWAALSSAIWSQRDPQIELDGPLVRSFLRSSVMGYLTSRRILAEGDYDLVYVFNGRMGPLRGMLRAAQEAGVEALVHERGRDTQHYSLVDNCMPHDIAPMVARVRRTWDTSDLDLDERRRVAREWYEGRTRGQMGSWFSYVDGQDEATLPDGWDADAHNVVLYTTTEFEYASIGAEWRTGLYASPTLAAEEIARTLSERGRAHLTVRLHPNPAGRDSSSVERLLALDRPRVTVVPPDSAVSTYGLMRAADVVVTSGSTAGIEASFWGRPSVLAGKSLYAGLDAVHEPTTHDKLFGMLEDPELGAKDTLPAEQYGFYYATLGEPFRRFEPDGIFSGTYRGERLHKRKLGLLRRRVTRALDKLAPRQPELERIQRAEHRRAKQQQR